VAPELFVESSDGASSIGGGGGTGDVSAGSGSLGTLSMVVLVQQSETVTQHGLQQ
jgi:hypothetical protein